MSGPPFNKLNRRDFIGLTLGSLLIAACGGTEKKKTISGELISSGSALGHMLRDHQFPQVTRNESAAVVIIGGGISGLSAARYLAQNGITDFILLELESETGGNSVSGKNELTAYPWAAHYLPVPNTDMKELLAFLEESGIITGYDSNGIPVYEESFLCFEPHERLFINGVWQEDLVPQYGLPADDRKQIEAFFQLVKEFREQVGSDGKAAFAIPLDQSSADEKFRALDTISLADLMNEKGWDSPYLKWYLNYCCSDDYGTSVSQTSAWAGIHYFASRRGIASNAGYGSVLTWPEGNAFLANKLNAFSSAKSRTRQAVFKIETVSGKVLVSCYDGIKKESYAIEADRVICSVPQFVRKRIMPDAIDTAADSVSYSPWIVANLTVRNWPDGYGEARCWDNVIYGSAALGYVDAMHQSMRTYGDRTVLTFYYPLTEKTPAEAREYLHQLNHEQITELILTELKKAHPEAAASIERLDVRIWGHAMVRPVPGYIWGEDRQKLAAPVSDKLFFAHSDLSGISIFEEAFYQGIRAAQKLLQSIS